MIFIIVTECKTLHYFLSLYGTVEEYQVSGLDTVIPDAHKSRCDLNILINVQIDDKHLCP